MNSKKYFLVFAVVSQLFLFIPVSASHEDVSVSYSYTDPLDNRVEINKHETEAEKNARQANEIENFKSGKDRMNNQQATVEESVLAQRHRSENEAFNNKKAELDTSRSMDVNNAQQQQALGESTSSLTQGNQSMQFNVEGESSIDLGNSNNNNNNQNTIYNVANSRGTQELDSSRDQVDNNFNLTENAEEQENNHQRKFVTFDDLRGQRDSVNQSYQEAQRKLEEAQGKESIVSQLRDNIAEGVSYQILQGESFIAGIPKAKIEKAIKHVVRSTIDRVASKTQNIGKREFDPKNKEDIKLLAEQLRGQISVDPDFEKVMKSTEMDSLLRSRVSTLSDDSLAKNEILQEFIDAYKGYKWRYRAKLAGTLTLLAAIAGVTIYELWGQDIKKDADSVASVF